MEPLNVMEQIDTNSVLDAEEKDMWAQSVRRQNTVPSAIKVDIRQVPEDALNFEKHST